MSSIPPEYCAMLLKKDAIDDGLAEPILAFLESRPRINVVARHVVDLSLEDALTIYEDEIHDDPRADRPALVAMNAMSMTGRNMAVGIHVPDSPDVDTSIAMLNAIKGKTVERDDPETIRGRFPFWVPERYDQYTFWFRAPFFVRNRVHVPSSVAALNALYGVLHTKGVSPETLYGITS